MSDDTFTSPTSQPALIEFDDALDLDDIAHPYEAAEHVLDAPD